MIRISRGNATTHATKRTAENALGNLALRGDELRRVTWLTTTNSCLALQISHYFDTLASDNLFSSGRAQSHMGFNILLVTWFTVSLNFV